MKFVFSNEEITHLKMQKGAYEDSNFATICYEFPKDSPYHVYLTINEMAFNRESLKELIQFLETCRDRLEDLNNG